MDIEQAVRGLSQWVCATTNKHGAVGPHMSFKAVAIQKGRYSSPSSEVRRSPYEQVSHVEITESLSARLHVLTPIHVKRSSITATKVEMTDPNAFEDNPTARFLVGRKHNHHPTSALSTTGNHKVFER